MFPITLTDLHLYLVACDCDDRLLTSGTDVIDLLRELVERSELEPLASQYHDFDGGGTTAVVLLAESHLVVHTWPDDDRLVVVDLSVCNHSTDNRAKADRLGELLVEAFCPGQTVVQRMSQPPRSRESPSSDTADD